MHSRTLLFRGSPPIPAIVSSSRHYWHTVYSQLDLMDIKNYNSQHMPDNSLEKALTNIFSAKWEEFVQQLQSQNERLMAELTESWRIIQSVTDSQLQAYAQTSAAENRYADLSSFKNARHTTAGILLHQPIEEVFRRKPYQRALMAVENHRQGLEGLIRSLPSTLGMSGVQANAVLPPHIAKGWRRKLAQHRLREHPLPLRGVVASEFWRFSGAITEVESHFFLALALMLHRMDKPWEIVRTATDGSFLKESGKAEALTKKLELHSLRHRGERALEAIRTLLGSMADRSGEQIIEELIWHSSREEQIRTLSAPMAQAHWETQLEAVESELQLEQSLEDCEDRILGHAIHSMGGIQEELKNLHSEIAEALKWLHAAANLDPNSKFPQPQADILPAASRMAELESLFRSEIEILPRSLETPARFYPLPRRRIPSKKLRPLETFQQAFQRCGQWVLRDLLKEAETEHRAIVQQIERARQVVAFARETAGAGPESDPRILQEATQNVISLLEFYDSEQPDWCTSAEARTAQAIASTYTESHLILGLHRLGILTYLARQGSRRAFALAQRRGADSLRRYIRHAFGLIYDILIKALIFIGWKSAASEGVVEVITRPYLPEEFTTDLETKSLPLLYRRLFRFEPLKDPRFLIGRETEMDAIGAARTLWDAGRPVSVILVGQRGSGKTSLINCALKSVLAGQEVIRGEFSKRLTTEAAMRGFLCELLHAGDPENLENFLNSGRRIVILEELERTYLRQIGHYGAVRSLQRIVAATNPHTLWILSTNQISFQFLNAAINLGQSFSHRINAGSASRENLKQAILLRHNLSGLRLKFSLPTTESGQVRKLMNSLTDRTAPDAHFFDAISRESAGVYRSAFEIWLGQIDRVQSGTMEMKPLLSPDLSKIVNHLAAEDLFTLVAIPQHGGLTVEDHSIIFQRSIAESQGQLNELLAHEIIEPDPAHPGFRIRPEAMRVVREALFSHNLL